MNKLTTNRFLRSLVISLLIIVSIAVILLPIFSFNNNQKYYEFINELSKFNVNKSEASSGSVGRNESLIWQQGRDI